MIGPGEHPAQRRPHWSTLTTPAPALLLPHSPDKSENKPGGGGLVAKSCLTPETSWTIALQAPLSGDSSSKNTQVRCHFLLQGIFLTQGLNLCLLRLLHGQVYSLPLSHLGSPANSTCILQIQVIIKAKLLIFFMFYIEMSFFYLFSTYQLYFSINYIRNGIYWSGKNESTILTSQSLIH